MIVARKKTNTKPTLKVKKKLKPVVRTSDAVNSRPKWAANTWFEGWEQGWGPKDKSPGGASDYCFISRSCRNGVTVIIGQFGEFYLNKIMMPVKYLQYREARKFSNTIADSFGGWDKATSRERRGEKEE